MANSESSKWRKFLQPVVAGLALFLAAATSAMQKSDKDSTDTRITAIEVRYEDIQQRLLETGSDVAAMRGMVYNIQSDVAFMRGKMEAGGK